MDQLIPLINKLQDVFSAIGQNQYSPTQFPIDLPQIAVVGSQSSGKSSVLENIVGKDFLPRGSGIVTRRPLILQLVNTGESGSKKGDEYGEFLHLPNQRFRDFNDIRSEIERETDRVTGKNKGISPQPINLKIFSPHVVNLTLIDLPGLTKVPVGDQPTNIEIQIRRMVGGFIERPKCLILAVTPGNMDLANSDALKLAREVDPEGRRTIGVITKLDLMDRGTDARDILTGQVYPLRLGFIGVINRSQEDINNRKPISVQLKKEIQFFQSHPSYKSIANRMGTAYLTRMLNSILVAHIKDALPEIKAKIAEMLQEQMREMEAFGDPLIDNNKNSKGGLLLSFITKFCADFKNNVDGKVEEGATKELYGGARINFIFNDIFCRVVDTIDPCDQLTLDDIRTSIRNATGPRSALFVPEASFELLVKKQISRLEEPALNCVHHVYDELQRIASQIESKELSRFQNLRQQVGGCVAELLRKRLEPTRAWVSNLINIELAYINTAHPDFLGGSRAVSHVVEQLTQEPAASKGKSNSVEKKGQDMKNDDGKSFIGFFLGKNKDQGRSRSHSGGGSHLTPSHNNYLPPPGMDMPATLKPDGPASERERVEAEIIKALVRSYFDIVRKNIADAVPKAVMHFLVNQSKEHIQNELVTELYKENLFESLLQEDKDVAAQRKMCEETLNMLKRAMSILNEVRDFSLGRSGY